MAKPGKAAGEVERMKRKPYEKELRKLQAELCHLQEWVKREGARVIVVFASWSCVPRSRSTSSTPASSW